MEITEIRMPRYRMSKDVYALKILSINKLAGTDERLVIPKDTRYKPFRISRKFFSTHRPYANGYIIRDRKGFMFFQPEKVFEKNSILMKK